MRLLPLLFVLGVGAAARAQDTTVVLGATIIDGNGGVPMSNGAIVIANGRIVSVSPAASLRPPRGARIVDAKGKWVIPGLMDANVHLVYGISIEFLARYEGRYEDLIVEGAQVGLKNGLTTMFDSWGPLKPLLRVRDRINRGEVVGSRLFVAGNIIGLTGPFGRDFNGAAETTASKPFVARIDAMWEEGTGPEVMWLPPDSLRPVMRAYMAKGMDFVKYAVSGHTQQEMLMFSPEQQRVIIEEARRAKIGVQTHTTSTESVRQAIELGVDEMQHCSITGRIEMPEATLQLLKRSPNTWCAVQPNTDVRLAAVVANDAFPRRVFWGELNKVADRNERRLIAAGIPVLLATDGGIGNPDEDVGVPDAMKKEVPTQLGEGHFLWFTAMKQKGMKPMDAIVAATRSIARAYHKDADFGTLERGKRADLVVLDADPIADIENVRKISVVMKDGAVIDRAALPTKRVLTSPP